GEGAKLVTQTVSLRSFRGSAFALPRTQAVSWRYIVPNLITDADRSAAVSGRRLNEHAAKWRVLQDLAVEHRVIGHAASQSQIGHAGFGIKMIKHMKGNLFQTQLEACRDIRVSFAEVCV